MPFFSRKYPILLLFLLYCISTKAVSLKYEIRGVWLTTNWGLDWPKKQIKNNKDIERQKTDLCYMLDQVQKMNMNVVFFQVRLRGDVLYPSHYEPWNFILTGVPGRDPGYDPLRFAVEECHKRNLQCHAWVVCMPLGSSKQAKAHGANSVVAKYPDMCKFWDNEWYLDPGHPGTAGYLASIAGEIVSRYDVDGIHLDYIRYPDKAGFPDRATFAKYKSPGETLERWRRENINRIVYVVYDTIKHINPAVKLSSAVIGKYNSLPSFSSYGWSGIESVYQDARDWLKKGKHDFIAPMIYFPERSFYPFLIDWVKNSYGHPVVSGLGAYRLCYNEGNWLLSDFMRQIYDGRKFGAGGQVYYRLGNLVDNEKQIFVALSQAYRYPALYPPMSYLGIVPPPGPEYISSEFKGSDLVLSWSHVPGIREYVLYGDDHYPVDTDNPSNIIATDIKVNCYELAPQKRYYAVTAVDVYHQESIPVQMQSSVPHYSQSDSMLILSEKGSFDLISVFNILGQNIYQGEFQPRIKIPNLPSGIYQIEMSGGKNKQKRSLVIN